jgi:hypothetical protein
MKETNMTELLLQGMNFIDFFFRLKKSRICSI